MSDPATHTATAITVGASSASLAAGTFLGVEYVVIGLALLGGAIAHVWLARMEIPRMLVAILGSTVIGVMTAQFSTAMFLATAIHFFPWLLDTLTNANLGAKMMVAFWVAFFAQKFVPVAFRWLDSKGGNTP